MWLSPLTFRLLVVIVSIASHARSDCMSDCVRGTPSVPVCTTLNTTFLLGDEVSPYSCLFYCNVGVRYVGACACPNNCGADAGRGACSNGRCECSAPWAGPDCSAFQCPFACSGHGTCQPASAGWPVDHCTCTAGWTAYDCSIATVPQSETILPYGDLYPNEPYYVDDKYGDDHPVFNLSTVASLHITVDPMDLDYILNPVNANNQTYVVANMTFDNGVVQETLTSIGLRLKGRYTRRSMQKNFRLKFDDFLDDNRLVGLKSVSIKSAAGGDPTLLRSPVATSWLRASHVPMSRLGTTELWVNGIHRGLYRIYEDLDADFLKSRFGNKGGNLYNVALAALAYLGDAPIDYENYTYDGVTHSYTLDRAGDEPWVDLTSVITTLHAGDVTALEASFNQAAFVRSMVVEVQSVNKDGYTWNHNNYQLYHNTDTGQLVYMPFDYDSAFKLYDVQRVNVYQFCNGTAMQRDRECQAPMMELVYDNPSWLAAFNAAYQTFAAAVTLTAQQRNILALAAPVCALLPRDPFYPLEYGPPAVLAYNLQLFQDFTALRATIVPPMLAVVGATTTTTAASTTTTTTAGSGTTGTDGVLTQPPPPPKGIKSYTILGIVLGILGACLVGVVVVVNVAMRRRQRTQSGGYGALATVNT